MRYTHTHVKYDGLKYKVELYVYKWHSKYSYIVWSWWTADTV